MWINLRKSKSFGMDSDRGAQCDHADEKHAQHRTQPVQLGVLAGELFELLHDVIDTYQSSRTARTALPATAILPETSAVIAAESNMAIATDANTCQGRWSCMVQ